MVNACMGSQYRSLLLQGNSMKKKTFPAHVNTAILIAKRIHDENQVQLLKDRRVVDAGIHPMTYQFLTFGISALWTCILTYQPGFWHISGRLAYQPGF